jgi:hypothetical protein
MTYIFQPQILDFGVFFRGQDANGHTLFRAFDLTATGSTLGLPFSTSFMPDAPPVSVTGIINGSGSAATIHITDPSGPGDVFRSGPRTSWPQEPVNLIIIALPRTQSAALPSFPGTTFSYAAMAASAGTPITVAIPTGFQIASGVGTLSGFVPRRIVITSVMITQLAGATDTVTVSFTGKIDFRQFFVLARTSLFTGAINVTLSPSGNASVPTDVVHAATGGFTFSITGLGPLTAAALTSFERLFNGLVSDLVTSSINASITKSLADQAADPNIGTMVSGLVPSVRRVTTSPTAITIDVYACGLFSAPPVHQPALRELAVAISPAPVAETVQHYTVSVTDRLSHAPIAGATVVLKNYAGRNAQQPASFSFTTDAQGHASIQAALHLGLRPDPRGRSGVPDGTFLSPTLSVTAPGYTAHSQDLLTV